MTADLVDWLARVIVLAAAALLAAAYWRGRRLAPPAGRDRLFFHSALLLLLALFWSPLHSLATQLFGLHVLQHLLLSALIPALFWFADPLPTVFAGLPAAAQAWLRAALAPGSRGYGRLKTLTGRGGVWLAFVACAWFWYDPGVHSAVRQSSWLHGLEVATMFGTAMLYWWHIAQAAPRLHEPLPRWVHMLYTYAGSAPIKLIGAAFIFSSTPFYDYTAAELARWGMSPAFNQTLGGILIWSFGGVAYTIAAGMFLRHLMQQEADKPILPIEAWSNDMLMPGA